MHSCAVFLFKPHARLLQVDGKKAPVAFDVHSLHSALGWGSIPADVLAVSAPEGGVPAQLNSWCLQTWCFPERLARAQPAMRLGMARAAFRCVPWRAVCSARAACVSTTEPNAWCAFSIKSVLEEVQAAKAAREKQQKQQEQSLPSFLAGLGLGFAVGSGASGAGLGAQFGAAFSEQNSAGGAGADAKRKTSPTLVVSMCSQVLNLSRRFCCWLCHTEPFAVPCFRPIKNSREYSDTQRTICSSSWTANLCKGCSGSCHPRAVLGVARFLSAMCSHQAVRSGGLEHRPAVAAELLAGHEEGEPSLDSMPIQGLTDPSPASLKLTVSSLCLFPFLQHGNVTPCVVSVGHTAGQGQSRTVLCFTPVM